MLVTGRSRPRPSGQRAVSGHRGVDRPPAGVEHGRGVGADGRDPVVPTEVVARRSVGAALVEDPADVVVEDALVGLGVQRVTLRSAAEDRQLLKGKYCKVISIQWHFKSRQLSRAWGSSLSISFFAQFVRT